MSSSLVCVKCKRRKSPTFEIICSCYKFCAECIKKTLGDPDFSVMCRKHSIEADADSFREDVRRCAQRGEIEKILNCSLELEEKDMCTKCHALLSESNRFMLPCHTHFQCIKCFESMAEEAIQRKRLFRCRNDECFRFAFYTLDEFAGRVRRRVIDDYAELVNRKSEIKRNAAHLAAMSQQLCKLAYESEQQVPKEKLVEMMRQIAKNAESYEFQVEFLPVRPGLCAVKGCDKKAYSFQRVEIRPNDYACSLRCLQLSFLRSSGSTLPLKSGPIPKADISRIVNLPEGETAESCRICYAEFLSSEMPILTCRHPFCRACMKEHITILVQGQNVSEEKFKCPKDKCGVALPPSLVQRLFPSGDIYENFLKARFEQMRILAAGEVMIMCAQPRCQCTFVAQQPDSSVKNRSVACPTCGFKMCVDGFHPFHPGKTCEEYNISQVSTEK